MSDDFNLTEQRDSVSRDQPLHASPLIQIGQMVGADEPFLLSVGADLDACAPLPRADLKTRAVLGEGVWTVFIDKRDRHQKLCLAILCVISVPDLLEIQLVPAVRSVFAQISLVLIFNTIPKRVYGLGQLPAVHFPSVHRVGHHGGITACVDRRAIDTHEPVFAPHLPAVVAAVVAGFQPGEEAFGPWAGWGAPR